MKPIESQPITIQRLKRVGIKLNPEMVAMLRERIGTAHDGRGVNIMVEGDLEFRLWVIETKEYGKELSFTFNDVKGGQIRDLGWKKEIAYHGEHLFWIEGFKDMEEEHKC